MKIISTSLAVICGITILSGCNSDGFGSFAALSTGAASPTPSPGVSVPVTTLVQSYDFTTIPDGSTLSTVQPDWSTL